jgi:fibronectin type 3 domain-containing protein
MVLAAMVVPGPTRADDLDPDPVQGLHAFMERQGHKPYDLFRRGEELQTLRVIFRDRQFGTQVWMLDHSPTVEHGGTASVWSPWNIEGSTIFVEGTRPLGDRMQSGWFFNADFSRMRPAPGGRPAVWSPDDPDVYYAPASPTDSVTRNNWRTGEQQIVAQWEPLSWPAAGKRVYGLTRDQRYLFVDLPNRGIFVPFERDDDHPIPQLPLYDGRPVGPSGDSVGGNHFCVLDGHERYGDLIALRTGMLVDRHTGERTNIAAPLCGNTNYLRAFHEGRVRYPRGEEWKAYGLPWFAEQVRLPTGLSMEQLYDLWRSLPHATHGHESTSPDWQYIATDGGTTRIVHVRDGESRSVRLSPNGGNYHLHWRRHPRFFVAWVRGWSFGSYRRPENANIEFQVFCDLTFQPIVDTKHRPNGYYAGGDFSMLSPDATKIHYGSSMTGRFRNYIAVMGRPRPPASLSWRAEDAAVVLSWQPSAYSRETRAYLVHRGASSGGPYELLTAKPVDGTSWRDATVEPGRAYYYVVTSLEHSGLESGYSDEAARAGVALPAELDAPLVVYAEVEDSIRDLPTGALPGLAIGVDRAEASDGYYLYRHPEAERGEAERTVHVPADGRYHVWASLRAADAQERAGGRWELSLGERALTVHTDKAEWTWLRAGDGPVALKAGRMAIGLATSDRAAQMDLLCLATDGRFVPEGPRPEDRSPPPPPLGLRAENVRARANRLVWQRPADPTLSHYQVYASREPDFEPGQETLVGSPTYEEFIDWGLRADTRYHYAVTAVDRRGNESAPVRAEAATAPRPAPPVEIELPFAAATLTGPFERSEAGGTRAAAYVVPQDPASNRVTWRVDIPREGDYYLWLRHLRRGSGSRGDDVTQEVRVRADGRRVATLGGGSTDLNVPDRLIAPDQPLAPTLWTWAWPGAADLEPARLPAGTIELELDNLAPNVRYDVLLVTDEPSFLPQDGRLRQR